MEYCRIPTLCHCRLYSTKEETSMSCQPKGCDSNCWRLQRWTSGDWGDRETCRFQCRNVREESGCSSVGIFGLIEYDSQYRHTKYRQRCLDTQATLQQHSAISCSLLTDAKTLRLYNLHICVCSCIMHRTIFTVPLRVKLSYFCNVPPTMRPVCLQSPLHLNSVTTSQCCIFSNN